MASVAAIVTVAAATVAATVATVAATPSVAATVAATTVAVMTVAAAATVAAARAAAEKAAVGGQTRRKTLETFRRCAAPEVATVRDRARLRAPRARTASRNCTRSHAQESVRA